MRKKNIIDEIYLNDKELFKFIYLIINIKYKDIDIDYINIFNCYRSKMSVDEICEYSNISHSTYYRKLKVLISIIMELRDVNINDK